jgi:hypothetical protein
MTDASSPKKSDKAILSGEQEVTLRRVAYGESPERTLRPADLEQLRALRLIENSKDGPVLTAEGRKRYETLPRALGTGSKTQYDDLLGALGKALDDSKR